MVEQAAVIPVAAESWVTQRLLEVGGRIPMRQRERDAVALWMIASGRRGTTVEEMDLNSLTARTPIRCINARGERMGSEGPLGVQD